MEKQKWSAFEDAALGAYGWSTALEGLADATGSMRAQLVGFGSPEWAPFNWVTNISDRDVELFSQLDGHSASINYRVASEHIFSDSLISEDHYEHVRLTLRSTDYIDYCEQTEMPFGCQTMVLKDQRGSLGLALLRSRKDGRTGHAQRQLFKEAADQVRTAVRMQIALEQQGSALITGTLESMAAACILFDRSGRVCATTPAAIEKLAGFEHLSIIDHRLVARESRTSRQLDDAFAALSSSPGRSHLQMSINAGPRKSQIVRIDLFRTSRREWSFGFEPFFMAVIDAATTRAPEPQQRIESIGFTVAETAIAHMLAQGYSRYDIARSRQVTVETLRGQLKIMYAKSGCRREAELVALLGRLPDSGLRT